MRDVAERLVELETRLARLLAAGWRNAGAETEALLADADALAEEGLGELARRVRAVAIAETASAAVRATALASAASRLTRAHIGVAGEQAEGWQPMAGPRRRRAVEPDMLLPLCRYSLGGREVWSCLRSRGFAVDWVLVEPPPLTLAGAVPWLRRPIHGYLHWRARYPLGEGREVQVLALANASWETPEASNVDPHAAFRKRLAAGKLREDKLPVWGGGSVHLTPLDRTKLDGYLWLDAAVQGDLGRLQVNDAWALVWDQEATPAVVAVMAEDGRLFKRLNVVHLVGGCPGDPVS
jgi:hypothetical protein